MKRTVLIILGIFLAALGFAQDKDEWDSRWNDRRDDPQVLIGQRIESISGFGGPTYDISTLDGQIAVFTGGGGAALFNNTFYLGGFGVGLATEHAKRVGDVKYNLNFGYGGIMMGYIINPNELIHFSVGTKLGWGKMALNPRPFNGPDFTHRRSNIFIFSPQAEIELNVTRWFKFNAGMGFRTVAGINNDLYTPSDFNKPYGSLSLMFGWFY